MVLIAFGFSVGRALRAWSRSGRSPSLPLDRAIYIMTQVVMLGINPLIIIGAFWMAGLHGWKLATLPFLGLFSLAFGGVLALVAARSLRLDRTKTGTLFVQGSFTNLGSFGTLFCFVFLGEESLVFAVMFRLLEELMYYAVGFPVAKAYGENGGGGKRNEPNGLFARLVRDPYITVSFAAIIVGGVLNVSGWERPVFYSTLNEWLVPLGTVLLLISIGFNLEVGRLSGYVKESSAIAAIKFIFVPICTVALGYTFGLAEVGGGVAMKAVLIMSAMPPAFLSLIPTQLYKLDKQLAGASFVMNNLLLVFILPLLYIALKIVPW